MSEEKEPISVIKFDLSEIKSEITKPESDLEGKEILNLNYLGTQFQLDGLKALKRNIDNVTSYDDLRKNHPELLTGLLKDLENLSKLPAVFSKDGFIPFKQSFYNEILLPKFERSTDLINFLKFHSDISTTLWYLEKISANILLGTGKDNIEEILKNGIEDYRIASINQGIKDLNREPILIKGADGVVQKISLEELQHMKEEGRLSGEQYEFIAKHWHQGQFMNGLIQASFSNAAINFFKQNNQSLVGDDRDSILLDFSNPPAVNLYNRIAMTGVNPALDPPYTSVKVSASINVDISDLKGKEFTAGFAPNVPKVEIVLSVYDESYDLGIPESFIRKHKVEKDPTSEYIERTCNQYHVKQYIDNPDPNRKDLFEGFKRRLYKKSTQEDIVAEAINNRRLTDEAVKELLIPISKKGTEKEKAIDADNIMFTYALNEAFEKHFKDAGPINDANIKAFSSQVEIYADLIASDNKDRNILVDNSKNLIKYCARKAGLDGSLTKSFKEKFVDAVIRPFSQKLADKLIDSNVQSIANKYPGLIESIKGAMQRAETESKKASKVPAAVNGSKVAAKDLAKILDSDVAKALEGKVSIEPTEKERVNPNSGALGRGQD